jgi:hypothetical protein
MKKFLIGFVFVCIFPSLAVCDAVTNDILGNVYRTTRSLSFLSDSISVKLDSLIYLCNGVSVAKAFEPMYFNTTARETTLVEFSSYDNGELVPVKSIDFLCMGYSIPVRIALFQTLSDDSITADTMRVIDGESITLNTSVDSMRMFFPLSPGSLYVHVSGGD